MEVEWRIYASVNQATIDSNNACSAPIHYLNQCWYIVNSTHRNIFECNFIWNWKIFIFENAFGFFSAKWRRFRQCNKANDSVVSLHKMGRCCMVSLRNWSKRWLMMTSSNGNIFRVTGHLCGEFTDLRWIPRTKASDAELWRFLWSVPDKRLSKQSWGWWFETQSGSLWRHSNVPSKNPSSNDHDLSYTLSTKDWTYHHRHFVINGDNIHRTKFCLLSFFQL